MSLMLEHWGQCSAESSCTTTRRICGRVGGTL